MRISPLAVGTLGIAGLVAAGALTFPSATAFADSDAVKRDEDTPDVVLTVVDDDDDTNATNSGDTDTVSATSTGNSVSTRDSPTNDSPTNDSSTDDSSRNDSR